ncbi:MAG: MFS transporter [Anaerolineae bacterium]|nr:MAG: MFS transporter [Anaerolineae bacterium]
MTRDLILLAIALFTWGFGDSMFFLFQPLYLQDLGANPQMIGNILGMVGVAMTVAHLPAGYLADRIGRRPLLYAAWTLGCVATWVMALSPALPWFVFGTVLYGLTSFVMVPMYSYITAARGKLSVGRAITLTTAAFSLGSVIGPLVGGWIGDTIGLHRTFLVAAVIFVFSTLIVLAIRAQPVENDSEEGAAGALRSLLNPRYLQYLSIVFVVMLATYLPQPLSQNYLQDVHHLSRTQIGSVISMRNLGVAVFNLALGQLNARVGFLLAQGAMALFSLALWRGTGLPWYMLGYFLMGSYQTARSLASAQARALVSKINMGLAYGLVETTASLAIIIAPPLAGFVYNRGPALIYPLSLAAIGLAFLLTLFFSPIHSKDVL